jgi:hypothetical protein
MIRDSLKDKQYLDQYVDFSIYAIDHRKQELKKPAVDLGYEPQYVYEIRNDYLTLMLACYSRGDPINELAQYFPSLMDAWEEAERLGKEVWSNEIQFTRHTWAVNLDLYIDNFWLVGLALALNIPDDQWQRLLALIGNEGEDELLDRVIASREPGRRIVSRLCHPKPYQRLLDVINAPKFMQAAKLKVFVDKWYAGLNRRVTSERPHWYGFHEYGDGYFGYWCIEAVAAVKAFGLDDSLCLGHPHYPGDLLRPDGPSTHPPRPEAESKPVPQKTGWLARLLKK